jgi:hypothetical protein
MGTADNSLKYIKVLNLQFMSVKSNTIEMFIYNVQEDVVIGTLNAENSRTNFSLHNIFRKSMATVQNILNTLQIR